MITAGIDIGSITAKAVILEDRRLLGAKVTATGYNAEAAGRRVYEELLTELALTPDRIDHLVATGYGRLSVKFVDKAVTEIICHGVGAFFQEPATRTLIDIGGQDSKALVMDDAGQVKNFTMNDKCAAGTGRFLEVMALALQVDVDELGDWSLKADQPAKISNTCTVFAESEVISLISKGESRSNIIAGIHDAIASRVASMAKRIGLTPPVMMTGGVAKNIGVVRALEKRLGHSITVFESAQINGALGAALLAAQT
jgi:predicted CoA-substrate-specific enzyme activase